MSFCYCILHYKSTYTLFNSQQVLYYRETLVSAARLVHPPVVKMARSSRGLKDGGVKGVGDLAHFEHKRTLTWIIPYFY